MAKNFFRFIDIRTKYDVDWDTSAKCFFNLFPLLLNIVRLYIFLGPPIPNITPEQLEQEIVKQELQKLLGQGNKNNGQNKI